MELTPTQVADIDPPLREAEPGSRVASVICHGSCMERQIGINLIN